MQENICILLPCSILHLPILFFKFSFEVDREITDFAHLFFIIFKIVYFNFRFLERYDNGLASSFCIPNPDTNAFLPTKSWPLSFELSRIGRIGEATLAEMSKGLSSFMMPISAVKQYCAYLPYL